MDKINVLVFPAEGINAVELHDALSSCVNLKVFGASSVARHGAYIYANYISGLPFISDPSFLSEFNRLLKQYSIDVIFPTHDTVNVYLMENEGSINAKIISGDYNTSKICRSKIQTYQLFKDQSFVPYRYLSLEELSDFPIFIKPDKGQGAVGALKINTYSEAKQINFENYLVTEYLPGEEYTVDCLTDNKGILKYISPRSRERLMAGVSVSGQIETLTDEICNIAQTINERLCFLGLWYFQAKKDKSGNFKLLEISTRCAGTMCLTRAKGINLPLLSVYTALGYDIEVMDNSYHVIMDRTLIGRYKIDYDYSVVYIDFDDTITLAGKLNLNAIRYLYQCKNKGIKLRLLTRHTYDIQETLRKYALSELLFEKIICIKEDATKSEYIDSNNAIFIDNAYKERQEVALKWHIPVFDVDGIEFLLDWRY